MRFFLAGVLLFSVWCAASPAAADDSAPVADAASEPVVERVLPPAGTTPSIVMPTTSGLLMPFAKTMLMLGVVLGLAYLSLGKGLGKLMERAQQGKRIKVVERIALDTRHSIYLVNVDGHHMVLAGGPAGVSHIKDVVDLNKPPAAPSFATVLKETA
jgi:flagellar biogenesis protein FliO